MQRAGTDRERPRVEPACLGELAWPVASSSSLAAWTHFTGCRLASSIVLTDHISLLRPILYTPRGLHTLSRCRNSFLRVSPFCNHHIPHTQTLHPALLLPSLERITGTTTSHLLYSLILMVLRFSGTNWGLQESSPLLVFLEHFCA